LEIKNDIGETISKKKINVWNPTVANLTLMALGSSAPEILLAVIETVQGLGECPGELGPSTIVGSAAFNLLVISGISIIAVNKENDIEPDRDMTTPDGVKKINDMGVFTVTAGWSLIAYIWLYLCLQDQNVTPLEAWITLGFFFVLIIMAFAADKYNSSKEEKKEDSDKMVVDFSAMEIYRELIADKKGDKPKDDKGANVRKEMKSYLKATFKTENIENVGLEKLKADLEGEALLSRTKYRKGLLTGTKPLIAKGEYFKAELSLANNVEDKNKNPDFGFKCLHYSVSESSESLKIAIVNKNKKTCMVRVKTIDAEAKAGEDFDAVDTILNFSAGDDV
jgi:solute carrier family 8 (sodium/calcium exchanger)